MRRARAQSGLITHRQALEAGLTRHQIRSLIQRGWWSTAGRGRFVVHAAVDGEFGASSDEAAPGYDHDRAYGSGHGYEHSYNHGLAERPAPSPLLLARARGAQAGYPSAVVCGITAARLTGFTALPRPEPDEPIHLLLPRSCGRAQPRGLVLHWGDPPADHIGRIQGVPVTAPARTLADLVLRSDRESAVSLMDAALHSRQVDDLTAARAATARRPGARRVAPWFALADGAAESALETRLRLLIVDAGLPAPQSQWPVRNARGRIVARLDLAWPDALVAVEADGRGPHDEPRALYRDRQRQNELVMMGWTILRFTWLDVTNRPAEAAAAIAAVLNHPRLT